jgi:hypothetical protein
MTMPVSRRRCRALPSANAGNSEVTVREAPGGLTMTVGTNPIGYELAPGDRGTFTSSVKGLIADL